MFVTLAGILAIVCYLLGCALLGRAILRREPLPRLSALSLGTLAVLLHALVLRAQIYQPLGIDLGLLHMVSLVGWLIASMHLMISSYRPLVAISLVTYPVAAAGLGLALLFRSPYHPLHNLARGAESHILLSILAYSVLFMAALHSLLLSAQNRELKQRGHSRGLLRALPPLQTMESVLFDMIGIGFVLLSLAIVSGFLTLDNLFAQHLAHKTVFTLLAWLVFGGLLAGHYWQGWRGQRAVRWTQAGFIILLLGFYGSKLVLELILKKV